MSKKLIGVFGWSILGLAAGLALLIAGGVAVAHFSAQGSIDKDQGMLWVMGVGTTLLMIGAMVVSVAWMRSIDEAAREAHKAAWFWGGCSGMGVGGVAVVMASLPQAATVKIPTWFDGRTDPAAYAATGAFSMLLLMLLGYTIVWVWWWWRRR